MTLRGRVTEQCHKRHMGVGEVQHRPKMCHILFEWTLRAVMVLYFNLNYDKKCSIKIFKTNVVKSFLIWFSFSYCSVIEQNKIKTNSFHLSRFLVKRFRSIPSIKFLNQVAMFACFVAGCD